MSLKEMNLEQRIAWFQNERAKYPRVTEEAAAYLLSTDFFKSPASTRFHGSYEGGLFEHSVHVYLWLKRLAKQFAVFPGREISDESAFIVGFFHDMCKAGIYQPTTRNVKDENGVWQKVPSYDFADPFPMGHGEKSVDIITRRMGIELCDAEAMAIRWHMGGFENAKAFRAACEWEKVMKQPPMAMLTHLADSLATYFDENTKQQMPEKCRSENMPEEVAPYFSRWLEKLPPKPEQEVFFWLYDQSIGRRPNGDRMRKVLTDYSDFCSAPAAVNGVLAQAGALLHVSLETFFRFLQIADVCCWPKAENTMQNFAGISLLHGLGKLNAFKLQERNVKDENGNWQKVPYYVEADDPLPMGSPGVKAVHIYDGYFRDGTEALAIRWIDGPQNDADFRTCGAAFEMYPFTFLAYAANLLAAYL